MKISKWIDTKMNKSTCIVIVKSTDKTKQQQNAISFTFDFRKSEKTIIHS